MACEELTGRLPATTYVLECEREFIETYESLPVLWDRHNLLYANKLKRNEAYDKLLISYKKLRPGATKEDVRKKINSLRSNYRRELRKVILSKSSGRGELYVPKSWVFECLHFLNKFEQPVAEIRISQDPLDFYPEQYDEVETEEQQTEGTLEGNEFEVHEPDIEIPDVKSPDIKRSNIKTEKLPVDEFQQYIYIKPNESFSSVTDQPETERPLKRKYQPPKLNESNISHSFLEVPKFNTLALYWTEKLNKLSTTQRIFAEKAINDVLLEAELGNLTKNSVSINDPEEGPHEDRKYQVRPF